VSEGYDEDSVSILEAAVQQKLIDQSASERRSCCQASVAGAGVVAVAVVAATWAANRSHFAAGAQRL
jgi:hypothetical protein